MSLYTHQTQNIRKTWLLMAVFLVIVIGLGWFFSWYYGNVMILYIVAGIAIAQVWMSYWFSHKLVLSMSGAQEISRESHRELWNIVENLAITAGLPVPKIYIIQDPVPNAFATGRNKKHAVVAVTTGLLKILDRTELEGVIAHELSHIGNRDMLVSTLAVTLVGFITLLADMFVRSSIFGGGDDNRADGRLGMIIMIVGISLLVVSPIIASLMRLAISRKREFLADASGAILTRYPEGLASALEKISAHSGTMKRANHATAHLFISNPFATPRQNFGDKKVAKQQPSFLSKLFMTHPPVADRVKALRGE